MTRSRNGLRTTEVEVNSVALTDDKSAGLAEDFGIIRTEL